MTEQQILDHISRGDESALDYLYKKYYPMMTKMVLKNNGTVEEANDVYQDALIVFWQKAISGNLKITAKISTYLYSICKNCWLKELNRKKRLSYTEHEVSMAEPNHEDIMSKVVQDAMEVLGDPCKSVLIYYYFNQMSMSEIADRMNYSNANTVKAKKYKCKKRLDVLIKKNYNQEDFFS
tara:strand:- start:135 stop:674 length:540 start_codon:yes stop_codon:yes gene_type:complete